MPLLPSLCHLFCSNPGHYADERGLQQCKSCPANSFSNTTGAWNCIQCGPGEVTLSTYVYSAPTYCIKCPIGTYATAEDYRCSRCACCPPLHRRLNHRPGRRAGSVR